MKQGKFLLWITILIFVISSTALPAVFAETKTVEFSGAKIGNARQLSPEDVIGAVLSFSADVQKISIACACWVQTDSSFTYTIYPFEKDYETSVGKDAVKTGTITYNVDSFQDIDWEAESPLPKGTYVLEITKAGLNGSQTGIRYDGEYGGQCVYENGIYTPDNSLRLQVVYASAPEKDYEELKKPEIDQSGKDIAPGAVMHFSDKEAESYFDSTGNRITAQIENNILVINITAGSDPNMYLHASEDAAALSAEEYPVLLLKVKRSEGAPLTGQFFFNTTEFSGPNPAGAVSFPYEDITDWQMIPVNLGSNTNYVGDIISYRFDPFSTTEADCQVEIEWIAFFQTMEAAKNFNGDFTQFETQTPSPTPAESTSSPSATAKATASNAPQSSSPAGRDEGTISKTTIIILAAVGIAVVAIIVILIIINRKKKKNA